MPTIVANYQPDNYTQLQFMYMPVTVRGAPTPIYKMWEAVLSWRHRQEMPENDRNRANTLYVQ